MNGKLKIWEFVCKFFLSYIFCGKLAVLKWNFLRGKRLSCWVFLILISCWYVFKRSLIGLLWMVVWSWMKKKFCNFSNFWIMFVKMIVFLLNLVKGFLLFLLKFLGSVFVNWMVCFKCGGNNMSLIYWLGFVLMNLLGSWWSWKLIRVGLKVCSVFNRYSVFVCGCLIFFRLICVFIRRKVFGGWCGWWNGVLVVVWLMIWAWVRLYKCWLCF